MSVPTERRPQRKGLPVTGSGVTEGTGPRSPGLEAQPPGHHTAWNPAHTWLRVTLHVTPPPTAKGRTGLARSAGTSSGRRHPFPSRVTWSRQVGRGRRSRRACWRGRAPPGRTSCRGVAARTGTQANCQDRLRSARQGGDWWGRPRVTHAVTITNNCRHPHQGKRGV